MISKGPIAINHHDTSTAAAQPGSVVFEPLDSAVTPAAGTRETTRLEAASTQIFRSGRQRQALSAGYQKSLVLEAALLEFRQLRVQEGSVDPDAFAARYSEYARSVRRLVDVELAVGGLIETAEPFPEPGEDFADCEICELLGAGAMARVYLALDQARAGRPVILKVGMRGEREAASIGRLRHPHIVDIEGVRFDPISGLSAIVMPYQGEATLMDVLDQAFTDRLPPSSARVFVQVGRSLANEKLLLDSEASPSVSQVLRNGSYVEGVMYLAGQLCEALEYAHEQGVWHHDLKPSNILITPQGEPVLLDFNLAADQAQGQVSSGGTLPYMAPEQILAKRYAKQDQETAQDPRADVYSLGVILFELLTGQLPFPGPSGTLPPNEAIHHQLQAVRKPLPSVRNDNPNVSAELDTLVRRCLAFNPDSRFQTIAEVAAALRDVARLQARREVRNGRFRGAIGGLSFAIAIGLLAVAGTWGSFYSRTDRRMAEAIVAYEKRSYQESIAVTAEILEMDPDHYGARLLSGLARVCAGDFAPQALEDLVIANSQHVTASGLHAASIAYARSGRRKIGRELAYQALQWAPDSPELHQQVALYLANDDPEQAIIWFQRCLTDNPNNVVALGYFSSYFHKKKKYELAAWYLEERARRGGNKTSLLMDLTKFYLGFWMAWFYESEQEKFRPRVQELIRELARRGVAEANLSRMLRSRAYQEPWMTSAAAQGNGSLTGYENARLAFYHFRLPDIGPFRSDRNQP